MPGKLGIMTWPCVQKGFGDAWQSLTALKECIDPKGFEGSLASLVGRA